MRIENIKSFFYIEEVQRIKMLFNSIIDVLEKKNKFITEEEYYSGIHKFTFEDDTILPYEDAIELKYEIYCSYKYNITSMTLIQLYSLWEQQIKDMNIENKSVGMEELRLLVNVLKHGKGNSEKKLKTKKPEYFIRKEQAAFEEMNEYRLYELLNLPDNCVDYFAEIIINYWLAIKI